MIKIETTPNPHAKRFVLDRLIKQEGKSTYTSCVDCLHNPLAHALFLVEGIRQVYFFSNTITITKDEKNLWDDLEEKIILCIKLKLPEHNPNYIDPDPETLRRSLLSKECQKIEEVLDKTIRPYLQADGGDINCLSLKNNLLLIRYLGACKNCPHSQFRTLRAVETTLKKEYSPEITVQVL